MLFARRLSKVFCDKSVLEKSIYANVNFGAEITT